MGSLDGKLALITGCTGGIGKATARSLARLGCAIAIHYNSASPSIVSALCEELRALGAKAEAFQADLSNYDGARKLHKEVAEKMGNPDILFNNAGIMGKFLGLEGSIYDITPEMFEHTWRTNTGTQFLLTQLCLPHMEEMKFGRIVFNSSIAAGTGGGVGPHYASSKSALHGLLHWIASRYAKDGITCNAVAPALIADTNMLSDNNAIDSLKQRIPVGRLGKPEEIASVVELLVTNAYLTNKIFVADGGMAPTAF